jgi:hypothetical protein
MAHPAAGVGTAASTVTDRPDAPDPAADAEETVPPRTTPRRTNAAITTRLVLTLTHFRVFNI